MKTDTTFARVPAGEYRLLILQQAALAALRATEVEGKQMAAAHQSKRRKLVHLLDRVFVAQSDVDQMRLWDDSVEISPDLKRVLNLP